MTKTPSFADRWPPHPTPPHGHRIITRWQGRARPFTAGLLAGVAAVVTGLVLAGELPGWALLIACAALCALPFRLYGWGLLETVAPLPDVRGPRHALDGEIPGVMAVADAVRTRRGLVEGDDTTTTLIPRVKP